MLISKIYPNAVIYGPYLNEEKNRWFVKIFYNKVNNFTMHYSRYLMQEFLGRILLKEEKVDHIDNNKLNDVIENLQILSHLDNINKSERIYSKEIKEICFQCNKEFIMTDVQQKSWYYKFKKGCHGPFCSKSCASIFRNLNRKY
jgi:hypothetical protein